VCRPCLICITYEASLKYFLISLKRQGRRSYHLYSCIFLPVYRSGYYLTAHRSFIFIVAYQWKYPPISISPQRLWYSLINSWYRTLQCHGCLVSNASMSSWLLVSNASMSWLLLVLNTSLSSRLLGIEHFDVVMAAWYRKRWWQETERPRPARASALPTSWTRMRWRSSASSSLGTAPTSWCPKSLPWSSTTGVWVTWVSAPASTSSVTAKWGGGNARPSS